MKDQPNKLDQLIKNSFEDFELEPEASSWVQIEEKLDKNANNKKVVYFYKYAAAASILLLLVAGFYFVNNQKSKSELAKSETKIEKNRTEKTKNDLNFIDKKDSIELLKNDLDRLKVRSNSEIKSNTGLNTIATKNSKNIKSTKSHLRNNSDKTNPNLYEPKLIDKDKIQIANKNDSQKINEVIVVKNEKQKELITPKSDRTNEEFITDSSDNVIAKTTPTEPNNSLLGKKTSILNLADAANYVAGRIDKREEKFFSINKNAGQNEGYSYQLDLGLFKIKKSRN